ncbi:MAG: xylose isomerase [Lentisphaeria bacterium]|nr:xylose isomerase [Lentisphaeria bacterium]NQZ67148.1 xylose isomerase [Lentisphaeria bacterium]
MDYFTEVKDVVTYEGPDSKNPLAYKWFNKDQVVAGKTMGETLRYAVAYWHTYKGSGADMFGVGTYDRPWDKGSSPLEIAAMTLDANFEFCQKLGVDYYCFHDRDIAPEGDTFAESCKNLDHVVALAEKKQNETGIKLLWGTACLFVHPRYACGAGTSSNLGVFATASSQIKHAMDATAQLGGENYVFWGGREGYDTLLNTNLKQELDSFASFLQMAVDYKKKIGFTGQFLIEPKPCEPTKHQYDHDSATVISFLREYDLIDHFKLNIEANHATLAGHTFEHELAIASNAGLLGSVDANRGDVMLGWDTDQFPTNLYDAVYAMMIIQKQGGLGSGGLNFDAKVRRASTDTVDLFHAHIGAMDTFARGLLIAQQIIDDGALDAEIADRYSSWDSELGKSILAGTCSFDELDAQVLSSGEPELRSGRQEYLENIVNTYI